MNKRTKQAMVENNTLEEELTRENKDVMTDLICYLRSASLSDLEIEQVRKDIIYMLLNGQQHHQDAHAIIGEDYRSFCDEILGALPKQTKKTAFVSETVDDLDVCEYIGNHRTIVRSACIYF